MSDIFDKDVWMPELIEILKYQEDEKDLPPEKQYFSQFGFDKLEVPEDCPLTKALMAELTARFNLHYRFRMLGAETMEMWQTFLQDRFLDGVHRFERGLAFYARNQALMDDVAGYLTKYEGKTTASGQDAVARIMARTHAGADKNARVGKSSDSGSDTNLVNGTSENTAETVSKASATPDSAINLSDAYAQNVVKQNDKSNGKTTDSTTTTFGKVNDVTETDELTYGHTVSDDGTDTTTYGRVDDQTYDLTRLNKAEVIDNVNHAIAAWFDLECQFVDSFQGCFLGIFGY